MPLASSLGTVIACFGVYRNLSRTRFGTARETPRRMTFPGLAQRDLIGSELSIDDKSIELIDRPPKPRPVPPGLPVPQVRSAAKRVAPMVDVKSLYHSLARPANSR